MMTMDSATLLPSLNLFTLVAVLVILVLAFLYFLRRRRNREAASRTLLDK
jgi:LPXTG-motif cell wall-anchored protein